MTKTSNYKSGKTAELIARLFLRLKGYKIISANYITGKGTQAGEVDIIAHKNKTIIFVEVKKRQTLETAAYAILPSQQKRIIRGAQSFLKTHPAYQTHDQRFDAILITTPFQILHLKNAWQAHARA